MDRRGLVTDSRFFLESTTCKVINNTSPIQGHEHPNQHQLMRTTRTETTTTKMKMMTTKTSKMTLIKRECTYPPTSAPYIMTWIHIIFANNQMRICEIFLERSMQTMDQHSKCNNITTNDKFYKLDTTTFACIIVMHTSETFKGF